MATERLAERAREVNSSPLWWGGRVSLRFLVRWEERWGMGDGGWGRI